MTMKYEYILHFDSFLAICTLHTYSRQNIYFAQILFSCHCGTFKNRSGPPPPRILIQEICHVTMHAKTATFVSHPSTIANWTNFYFSTIIAAVLVSCGLNGEWSSCGVVLV